MPEVKESHLLLYRVCVSCCLTVVILAAIEAGSYVALSVLEARPWLAARVPFLSNFVPDPERPKPFESSVYREVPWARQYWKEESERRVSYASYVGWREVPFSGQTVNVGADQRRRTPDSGDCGGSVKTIWMFGGSTMLGTGSPDWETIPSNLARLLETSGAPACVVNFGQTGWRNSQELIELLQELKRNARRPDLVVFYDGYNDGYAFYQSGKIDVHMNYDIVRKQLERASERRIGSLLLEAFTRSNTGQLLTGAARRQTTIFGYASADSRPPNEAEAKLDLEIGYLRNLDVVRALAEQYRFRYAFFWQPVIFAGHKQLTAEEERIRRFFSTGIYEADAQYRQMATLLRSGTIPHLFDLSDVFDAKRETVYIDYVHVGPEGNRLIALRMRDVLKHAGLLSAPAAKSP